MMPRAIIFDLDDTLAESFQPPTEKMLEKLKALGAYTSIAIMSAASHGRVERDVMSRMTPEPDASFYMFSDSSAHCHTWKDRQWKEVYAIRLLPNELANIQKAVHESIEKTGILGTTEAMRVLEREASVAITAARPDSTQAEKDAWDPDGAKRIRLQKSLQSKLPDYEILIGGKTTIDITKRGVTKAYGVEWLAQELGVQPSNMLFIGDGFYDGGNDAVVIPTGIQTLTVDAPANTEKAIDNLIARFAEPH